MIATNTTRAPLLSNSLADLAERIRVAASAVATAEHAAAEQAINAGKLLREAKGQCRHGEWLAFLDRAAMPERKAQRYMQLAASGLKPDTVSDLGGIGATLRWMQGLRLPASGECLFAMIDETGDEPFGVMWLDAGGGYRFAVFGDRYKWVDTLTKPIFDPDYPLPMLFAALGSRFPEMTFSIGPDTIPREVLAS
jgi:hypothetical protein